MNRAPKAGSSAAAGMARQHEKARGYFFISGYFLSRDSENVI